MGPIHYPCQHQQLDNLSLRADRQHPDQVGRGDEDWDDRGHRHFMVKVGDTYHSFLEGIVRSTWDGTQPGWSLDLRRNKPLAGLQGSAGR